MSNLRALFAEWKPDQPAYLNEGLTVADGCVPIANGYAPFGSFTASTNGTLASRCYGATAYRTSDATYLFAATATNIYRYSTAGYASLIGSLDNTKRARFASYATLMLATNGVNSIKKFDPAAPGAMTNLGGSPPIARYIAVVGGFTVLAYVSNSPTRVAWSDQGNPENWTAGGASEAGVFDMAGGGDITGIIGGEYGLIFQENRIVRMDYTASDTIWQFNEIATDIGCVIPGSLVTWGKLTFFYSTRGFMICDGASVTPIGNEKVDRWFKGRSDRSYYDSVTSVIDPSNSLYIVSVPSAFPANTLLIFNYTLGKWSTASLPVEFMAPGYAQSITLEDLDVIYGNLDAIPISLDSESLKGGSPLMLIFNDQHALGALSGPPLPASFVDSKREPITGRQARLRSVRPITDAAAPMVTIAGANSLSDTPSPTTYSARRGNGTLPVRESWNSFQATLTIPSQPWSFCQGIDIALEQGGRA